ncbi:unnamed protein product [Effrenium voratum]|uniref:Uncharacterized protein n=1 Tax=Effrenium voratum TaxID=2562239 RepID=A0AA36NGL9_9DINO|nr:unnamed protein product [Effrenium voratum]
MSRFEDKVPTASVRSARRSIQAILDSIDDLLALVPQKEQEAARAVAETRKVPGAKSGRPVDGAGSASLPHAPDSLALTFSRDAASGTLSRAGGLRILLGSAAIGAIAGGLTLTNLPVVSTFSVPIGAAAGVWCAQLPDDGTMLGKAGDICRSLGHAATIFFKEFQSDYRKQK